MAHLHGTWAIAGLLLLGTALGPQLGRSSLELLRAHDLPGAGVTSSAPRGQTPARGLRISPSVREPAPTPRIRVPQDASAGLRI